MKNWKIYAGIGVVLTLILLFIIGSTYWNSRRAARQAKANGERIDVMAKDLSSDLITHLNDQANAQLNERSTDTSKEQQAD